MHVWKADNWLRKVFILLNFFLALDPHWVTTDIFSGYIKILIFKQS